MITEAHANLMVVIAFALGVIVALAIPAIVRDLRTWRWAIWLAQETETPADQPGQQQPVQ